VDDLLVLAGWRARWGLGVELSPGEQEGQHLPHPTVVVLRTRRGHRWQPDRRCAGAPATATEFLAEFTLGTPVDVGDITLGVP
jgi:hypothetical protein